MRKTSGILADTEELRKLILEHPDYPIAVICSEEVNCGDYCWEYASDITFRIGVMLDCEQPVDDCHVFNDKDDFYEKLEEWLFEYMCDELNPNCSEPVIKPTEEEFQEIFAKEKAKYEPFWKNCIFIYADH